MRNLARSGMGVLLCVLGGLALAQAQSYERVRPINCERNYSYCTERQNNVNYEGQYIGHDEPALLFYSHKPGSGDSSIYFLTLPKDPRTLPKQDGTGGTFNFQLHPAFWFGMAICDSQSDPNFTDKCEPDTDANIFDNADPAAPDWIGHHPGAAFMELQFYPPGWVGFPFIVGSCDATRYCAAINIFSLGIKESTGQLNNRDCLINAGLESGNFAFITRNGTPVGPPDPLNFDLTTFTPDPSRVLLMNPGDTLQVILRDTPGGLRVNIIDLTTRQTGFMTASRANGFAQVNFDPDPDPRHPSKTCSVTPYDFHPMYSTSSEHTRVPWAVHSFNVAFSDEIGHFEYCNVPNGVFTRTCPSASASDPRGPDADDRLCFGSLLSTRIQIGGCIDSDVDFDSVPYQTTWPGSVSDRVQDRLFNPRPIQFTSPVFISREESEEAEKAELRNYSRVAFEADLPAIEGRTCNRLTGAGCVNPPRGSNFYPIYTTAESEIAGGQCVWQFGGAHIRKTKDLFGGNSTTEFGSLLPLVFQDGSGSITLFENFRRVLDENPCRVDIDEIRDRD